MPRLDIPAMTTDPVDGYPAGLGRDLGPYFHAVLGDLAGLTQFGVHIETLPPGSTSSLRHWHEAEDELIYVLAGAPVLDEDGGETPLAPGDAAAFPAGNRNGHHLLNPGPAGATYLVIGMRGGDDVVHYPDHDLVYRRKDGVRSYSRRDGSALPASLDTVCLPRHAAPHRSGRIDVATLPERRSSYPEPHAALMAQRTWKALGHEGGLTQFGVNLFTLAPGGASALRHWHSAEDELVYVLAGALELVEDGGPAALRAGDAAGFKAGVADGHHLVNRSDAPARFLVVGARAARDTCTYSDVDLICETDGPRSWFTRRDGSLVKED